eukprot:5393820-Alexandrium_andersonii.AAC.1
MQLSAAFNSRLRCTAFGSLRSSYALLVAFSQRLQATPPELFVGARATTVSALRKAIGQIQHQGAA